MNREIFTYTDLRLLGKASYWEKIKKYPQITVTADLRKCLKGIEEYDKVDGMFKNDSLVKVSEFRKLSELVLPHWTDDETKFHETIVLSQFFRNELAQKGRQPEMRNRLIGCRRNQGMILSSIILLEEAGISPNDINSNGDKNIELLLDAWKYLIKNDPAINHFHQRLKQLENRSAWDPIINKLFGQTDIDTLIFHGFYFFTPIQQRIMNLMEKCGFTLKFLFSYDERYPYANEIWRKTYCPENGYPAVEHWIKDKGSNPESYGEIFEGRKAEIPNKLNIKEYASVMEFVHEMKHAKEQGYYIYSSNPHTANQILKDFYPEEYGERKLLSYPIGQFVSTLNKMWDEDLQDIVLDEDHLIECFSSGWLAFEGQSGKQYIQDLMNIMPFFKDCTTIEEWEKRIGLLQEINKYVIAPFQKDWDIDDNVARWQEIMGNPFLNFSVFSVSEDKLDIILQLIKQLLSMAKSLFEDNKTIRVQDHIRKLDLILKQHEISNELYEEERELVKDLFEKLSDPSGFTAECFPSDISNALNLYMSGRFQEGEIQSNKVGMVSPIYQIDAAIVKNHGKVHICLCDVKNMPGGKKQYIWPLTGRLIKQCYARTNNPLIKNMCHVMETPDICNRYFLYAALKNKDVQISWISNMNDKLLAPSPYIKMICEATGIDITPAKRKRITQKRIEELPEGKPRTLIYDNSKMPQDTAKEAKMDYAICPMKYAFGYIVEKFPTFQSEFHQNYAINGLIAAIYSLMKDKGMSIDEIYQQVIQLFPAMRKVEKRQVYDYLQYENSFKDMDYAGFSELGEIAFPEERLKVHFPNKNVRQQALQEYAKLLTPDGKQDINFYTTAADTKTNPYQKINLDVCLFCQHQNYCRYAVFHVDQEALYD